MKRGEISDATLDVEPNVDGWIEYDELDWGGAVHVDDSGRATDADDSSFSCG